MSRYDDERRGVSRMPVALLSVGIGAVLIAVALLVLTQGQWGDRGPDLAEPAPTASVSVTTAPTDALAGDATPTVDASAQAREAEEARAALRALASESTCDNVYADSRAFLDFGHTSTGETSRADDRLPIVTLQEVSQNCGAPYAEELGRYIARDPQMDQALATSLATHLGIATIVAPAPEDAESLELFRSGDVRCTLTADGAGCSVSPAEGGHEVCPDGSGRFSVAVFHGEYVTCPGTVDGGSTELAVGHSSAVATNVCTVPERETVRCWSTTSGHGFQISPLTVEQVDLG